MIDCEAAANDFIVFYHAIANDRLAKKTFQLGYPDRSADQLFSLLAKACRNDRDTKSYHGVCNRTSKGREQLLDALRTILRLHLFSVSVDDAGKLAVVHVRDRFPEKTEKREIFIVAMPGDSNGETYFNGILDLNWTQKAARLEYFHRHDAGRDKVVFPKGKIQKISPNIWQVFFPKSNLRESCFFLFKTNEYGRHNWIQGAFVCLKGDDSVPVAAKFLMHKSPSLEAAEKVVHQKCSLSVQTVLDGKKFTAPYLKKADQSTLGSVFPTEKGQTEPLDLAFSKPTTKAEKAVK